LKYAIGQCTKTAEECIYQHRKATADEKEAIEKFKAKVDANKAKAKAKAKSTPSSPRATGTKKTSAAAIIPLVVMAAMTKGATSLTAPLHALLVRSGDSPGGQGAMKSGLSVRSGDSPGGLGPELALGRLRKYSLLSVDQVLYEVPEGTAMMKHPRMGYNPENNNQACFMEPEPAQAEALRKAKMLADELGYLVPYGWPVVWGRDYAWHYLPGPEQTDVSFDVAPIPPVVMKRAKAVEELSRTMQFLSVLHFGSVPKSFRTEAAANMETAMTAHFVQGQRFSKPSKAVGPGIPRADADGVRRAPTSSNGAGGPGIPRADAPVGRRTTGATMLSRIASY